MYPLAVLLALVSEIVVRYAHVDKVPKKKCPYWVLLVSTVHLKVRSTLKDPPVSKYDGHQQGNEIASLPLQMNVASFRSSDLADSEPPSRNIISQCWWQSA